ncbi:MAG: hypothetical protein LC794_15725 [Acidobacteria bacterium]|nr:hypothetical protein [Acidobacteriota bacterium]
MAHARCGGIEGRLTTPEGWMIPMARIYFFNKETKNTTKRRKRSGWPYTTCLLPATYDLSVNAQGFNPQTQTHYG